MWFFVAIASAVIFGLAGFLLKYSTATAAGSRNYLLFGLYTTGGLGFLLLALLNGTLDASIALLLAGIMVGLGSVLGNIAYVLALDSGPASLTAPIVNASVLLIVVMSVVFYGEVMDARKIVGVILMVGSLSLLPIDPNESISIKNRIWYLFAIGGAGLFFLRNGGLKITEEADLNNTLVLLYAYLFGLLWFVVRLMRRQPPPPDIDIRHARRVGLISGLSAGVFSFGGIQLYAYALSIGPATLVSPIFAANGLVVALLSVIIFRERLSQLQTLALAGIVVGIALLRI